MSRVPAYAELHCSSNFSFQRGASHADELIERADQLGYEAIAITDECSLAGVVRAWEAINRLRKDQHARGDNRPLVQLIVGAEFHLQDGPSFVLLAPSRAAYAQISRLITRGRQTSPKGQYRLLRRDCDQLGECIALWLPDAAPSVDDGLWLASQVADCAIAVHQHRCAEDEARMARLQSLSQASGLRCVAAGGVLFHDPSRKALHDVLTAVRLGKTVHDSGLDLLPNAERHLRQREELASLYPPAMLDEAVAIARRCHFDLAQLRYDYPQELVPPGETPTTHLRHLTEAGLRWRWPDGVPDDVRRQIDKELTLIAELRYEPFFLTVEDIVRHARSIGILCQGRGSAANSAVCYAIGVTSVRPENENLLFERFLSKERIADHIRERLGKLGR